MITRFSKISGQTWLDELERIKAMRDELRQYGGMMTPYEFSTIKRSIKARVESSFQLIASGAVGEYEAAINKYKASKQAYEREIQKEIQRWDASRLNSELANAKTFVDLVLQGDKNPLRKGDLSHLDKIKGLYTEAQASGDMYKQRAMFEVLQAILPKIGGPDRVEVNQVVKDAARGLESLRVTDGMKNARDLIVKSTGELMTTRDQLQKTGEIIGEPYAFEKNLRRVNFDMQSGEVTIYEPDSSEVTGVYINQPNVTEP